MMGRPSVFMRIRFLLVLLISLQWGDKSLSIY